MESYLFSHKSKKRKEIELISQIFQTKDNEVVSLGHLWEAWVTFTAHSVKLFDCTKRGEDIFLALFTREATFHVPVNLSHV